MSPTSTTGLTASSLGMLRSLPSSDSTGVRGSRWPALPARPPSSTVVAPGPIARSALLPRRWSGGTALRSQPLVGPSSYRPDWTATTDGLLTGSFPCLDAGRCGAKRFLPARLSGIAQLHHERYRRRHNAGSDVAARATSLSPAHHESYTSRIYVQP